MKQKRFQYWSSEGIKWTKWFDISDKCEEDPIQFKGRTVLKNEYRVIDK